MGFYDLFGYVNSVRIFAYYYAYDATIRKHGAFYTRSAGVQIFKIPLEFSPANWQYFTFALNEICKRFEGPCPLVPLRIWAFRIGLVVVPPTTATYLTPSFTVM